MQQHYPFHAQRGVALPVTLIILLVMLISSIYLLRSTNSTTLTASNLAYDSAQAKAVDFALHQGFQWLSTTANGNKALLNASSTANGYDAVTVEGQSARSAGFWQNAVFVNLGSQRVEYVIHRLCSNLGAHNAAGNRCTRTADNPFLAGAALKPGDSAASDSQPFSTAPRVHYVITARIAGARGGNVVNQMVVHIGA